MRPPRWPSTRPADAPHDWWRLTKADPGSTTRASDDGQILAMGNFAVDSTNQCADDVVAQATDLVAALDGANRWVWLDPTFILRDSRATNTLVAVTTP